MWNQLPAIEQYSMDQVCKIPTMENVYLPVDYHLERASTLRAVLLGGKNRQASDELGAKEGEAIIVIAQSNLFFLFFFSSL
jgi:hypothetical protein